MVMEEYEKELKQDESLELNPDQLEWFYIYITTHFE